MHQTQPPAAAAAGRLCRSGRVATGGLLRRVLGADDGSSLLRSSTRGLGCSDHWLNIAWPHSSGRHQSPSGSSERLRELRHKRVQDGRCLCLIELDGQGRMHASWCSKTSRGVAEERLPGRPARTANVDSTARGSARRREGVSRSTCAPAQHTTSKPASLRLTWLRRPATDVGS